MNGSSSRGPQIDRSFFGHPHTQLPSRFAPAGAWIDQALVLWVLVALVVAMTRYFVSWYRRTD